jgi:uncharacterized protein (DUF4415 family)
MNVSKERITRRSLASPRTPETDWSGVDGRSDADIAAAVHSDRDAAPLADDEWFRTAQVVEPPAKRAISIRVDQDVLDWFRDNSDRYQSKINAVLRAYMEHERARRRA